MKAEEVSSAIRAIQNPEKAIFLQRFFRTGKGEYAEGDLFLGLTVPDSRTIASKYGKLPLKEIEKLLHSKYHEERLVALFLLIRYFNHNKNERPAVYELYLKNTKYVNNWDLVDSSADKIVGEFLRDKKDRKILDRLAQSTDLWEKRIAIISTFQFIKKDKSAIDTFRIADILLGDSHDLIHKAVGWMLREAGKRISQEQEEDFLKTRYKKMPRTMLRYAIEKFEEDKRKKYLQGVI